MNAEKRLFLFHVVCAKIITLEQRAIVLYIEISH